MPKVAIIYKTIPQYRRDFFNGLRDSLAKQSTELNLIYGQPSPREAMKNDSVDLDWALKLQNKIWEFERFELYWQPVLPFIKNVDLVIVEQASRLLVNYFLLIQNVMGIRKMAFWGHGKNFQESSANSLAEWVKRQVSTRVHWWFAYNETSARVVRAMGFPPERITLVQNAIDTQGLILARKNLTPEEITQTRIALNLHSPNVGIYSGGMYPEKRLHFLLEALHLVRARVPDFEMIFIGGGVDAPLVERASTRHPWIHYVGPKFDQEKVPYYAISKLFLMPGMIGLGILDTFALETPLVTTDIPNHSPEIEYLKDGINGVMVRDAQSVQAYANVVADLLLDDTLRAHLVRECQASQKEYSIEIMIERFTEGVIKSLEAR